MLERIRRVIQDRDGGAPLLRGSRRIFPFIQRVFADSGYAGEKVTTATLIAVEPPLPSVVIDGGAALQKAVVIVREAPEIFCCQWVVLARTFGL